MTTQDDDTTTESSTDPRGGRSRFERRPLLKALGVGSALALGSSVGAASGTGSATAQSDSTGERGGQRVDPLYGYATPTTDDIPAGLEPDREVELLVAPPGENRPTLFYFEPSGLHVTPGDLVQFTFTTPDHTVTPYHPGHGFQRRVPENVPPFSSPIVNAGGAWFYRFEREGVYDLYCGPHHVLGMVMRIVVGDLSRGDVPAYESTFEGREGGEDQPPLEAPFSKAFLERELNEFSDQNENCEWVWLTPQQVLDAAALDPLAIQEASRVPFAAVVEELGYTLD